MNKKTALILVVVLYFVLNWIFTGVMQTNTDINEIRAIGSRNVSYFELVEINEYNNFATFYERGGSYFFPGIYQVPISNREDFGHQVKEVFGNNIRIKYISGTPLLNILSSAFLMIVVQALGVVGGIFLIFFLIGSLVKQIKVEPGTVQNILLGDDKGKFFSVMKPEIKFSDVIGQVDAKDDLMECIKFFKDRKKYIDAGFKIPKGLLFTGPPGTGKTLLAQAFAAESGVTFISLTGSDFIELYVGVGSKRVKELFAFARQNKPSIIYIDEIDAIGKKREKMATSGHNEHAMTLNKLLTEMDGFANNDDMMVIGSTNLAEVLDKALMRRFEKEIVFDYPNRKEREDLFRYFTNKVKLSPEFKDNFDKSIDRLAGLTARLSGSDIESICNQAVSIGLKKSKDDDFKGVNFDDFEKAVDTATVGMEKKEKQLSEQEKNIVAYHEAGHTLISYIIKQASIPIKVSIIPHGQSALGFTKGEPSDKKIYTYEELLAQIYVLFGGRVAEKYKFNHTSTGASDDINKIKSLAYNMITTYGMSPDGVFCEITKLSGETLKTTVDNKVKGMIDFCEQEVTKMMTKYKDELEIIATYLNSNEVMTDIILDDLLTKYNIKNSIIL